MIFLNMAEIRDTAFTLYSTATANMVMEMPEHQTGDLLVACLGKDTAANFSTPGGWTNIQSGTTAGSAGGIWAKRATSSSETVTFTLTSETCAGIIIAVKDVYGSTVADAIPTSARQSSDSSTLPFTGVGLTTAYDNSIVIHSRNQDTTAGTSHLPPWVNLAAIDVAAGGLAAAYSFVPSASTVVSAPSLWGATADDGRGQIIEIRDGSSGTIKPPYIPLSVTPSVLISSLTGTTGDTGPDIGTYIAAASIAITSVAGKTVTGVAVATTADSGYNPFRGSMRNAGASSTTNLNHVELNRASPIDVTTGDLIFGTYLHLAPRDYVDTGKAVQGGKYIILGSTSGNWRAWVVGGQFSKTDNPGARNNFLIEPSYTSTQYDSAGTADFASLDYLAFGSSGYYGAPSVLWNELWELRTAVIAGGTTTNPFNFNDLVTMVNSGCGNIPVIQQTGALGQIWIPLQFGGVASIGISCNLKTFQWPTQADETDYVDFHVNNNSLGVEFYGVDSNDLLHFTNCLFVSDSSYYWRFNSSHSASADVNFLGTSVVNATVILRSTVTLDTVSFINCTTFTQNSAVLNNCTFTNTKVTSATVSDLENITNCSFVSSGTGHAIEVSGTAGAFDFDGNTFSGYAGTDGSTGNEAIYVNIASGTVTINVTGGGSTPSVRTAGATIVKNNAVTLKVTVVDANNSPVENAQTAIYQSSDALQLMNEDTNASGIATETFNYTSDTDIYIRVRKSSTGDTKYYPASTTGTITSSGFTTTITLIEDTTA